MADSEEEDQEQHVRDNGCVDPEADLGCDDDDEEPELPIANIQPSDYRLLDDVARKTAAENREHYILDLDKKGMKLGWKLSPCRKKLMPCLRYKESGQIVKTKGRDFVLWTPYLKINFYGVDPKTPLDEANPERTAVSFKIYDDGENPAGKKMFAILKEWSQDAYVEALFEHREKLTTILYENVRNMPWEEFREKMMYVLGFDGDITLRSLLSHDETDDSYGIFVKRTIFQTKVRPDENETTLKESQYPDQPWPEDEFWHRHGYDRKKYAHYYNFLKESRHVYCLNMPNLIGPDGKKKLVKRDKLRGGAVGAAAISFFSTFTRQDGKIKQTKITRSLKFLHLVSNGPKHDREKTLGDATDILSKMKGRNAEEPEEEDVPKEAPPPKQTAPPTKTAPAAAKKSEDTPADVSPKKTGKHKQQPDSESKSKRRKKAKIVVDDEEDW